MLTINLRKFTLVVGSFSASLVACSIVNQENSDHKLSSHSKPLEMQNGILDSAEIAGLIKNKGWMLEGWRPHNKNLGALIVNKGDTVDSRNVEIWVVKSASSGFQQIGQAIKLKEFPPTDVSWIPAKTDYKLLQVKLEYPTENVVGTMVFQVLNDSLVETYNDAPRVCKAATVLLSDTLNPALVSYASPDPWRGGCDFLCEEEAVRLGAYPLWATVHRWSGRSWVVDSLSSREFYRDLSNKYSQIADSLDASNNFREYCHYLTDSGNLRLLARRARQLSQ